MLREIHLKNVGPGEELSFEFNERYNLLTGDNGVGKSFILDVAWWLISRSSMGLPPRPNVTSPDEAFARSLFIADKNRVNSLFPEIQRQRELISGSLKFAGDPSDEGLPLTIYVRSDGGVGVWDPLRHGADSSRGGGRTIGGDRFTVEEIWNGQSRRKTKVCNGLLQDVTTWQLEKSRPFLVFEKILHALSPSDNERLVLGKPERYSLEDARRVPVLSLPYGEVPLTLASAAVRQISAIGYILVWAIEEHLIRSATNNERLSENILFMFDEIESHLHPKWQRKILTSLNQAIGIFENNFNVQILSVTHSPLVLASLESTFDPGKDALFNFSVLGRNITAKKLDWRSHGDVASWLTSEVFNLGEARSIEAEEAIKQARAIALNSKATAEDFEAAHAALQTVLGDTDPFWVKWVARAERAGFKP